MQPVDEVEKTFQEIRQYLEDNHVTIGTVEALAFTDFVSLFMYPEYRKNMDLFIRGFFNGIPLLARAIKENQLLSEYNRLASHQISEISTFLRYFLKEELLKHDIDRSFIAIAGYKEAYEKILLFQKNLHELTTELGNKLPQEARVAFIEEISNNIRTQFRALSDDVISGKFADLEQIEIEPVDIVEDKTSQA